MQKHAVHLWLLEAKQCLQKVEKQEEERLAVNLVSCLPQKLSARTACNIMSQKSNHHHHCQNGTITVCVHLSSRCFTQGTVEENWSSQTHKYPGGQQVFVRSSSSHCIVSAPTALAAKLGQKWDQIFFSHSLGDTVAWLWQAQGRKRCHTS